MGPKDGDEKKGPKQTRLDGFSPDKTPDRLIKLNRNNRLMKGDWRRFKKITIQVVTGKVTWMRAGDGAEPQGFQSLSFFYLANLIVLFVIMF